MMAWYWPSFPLPLQAIMDSTHLISFLSSPVPAVSCSLFAEADSSRHKFSNWGSVLSDSKEENQALGSKLTICEQERYNTSETCCSVHNQLAEQVPLTTVTCNNVVRGYSTGPLTHTLIQKTCLWLDDWGFFVMFCAVLSNPLPVYAECKPKMHLNYQKQEREHILLDTCWWCCGRAAHYWVPAAGIYSVCSPVPSLVRLGLIRCHATAACCPAAETKPQHALLYIYCSGMQHLGGGGERYAQILRDGAVMTASHSPWHTSRTVCGKRWKLLNWCSLRPCKLKPVVHFFFCYVALQAVWFHILFVELEGRCCHLPLIGVYKNITCPSHWFRK